MYDGTLGDLFLGERPSPEGFLPDVNGWSY